MHAIVPCIGLMLKKGILKSLQLVFMILKNIRFSYSPNQPLFKNFNFDFSQKGYTYIITGKNGCGKSTLLKMITNLITDYDGQVINNLYMKIRSNLDFLGLDPSKTGKKNIYLLEHDKSKEFRQALNYYIEQFGLFDAVVKKLSTMSTGTQLKTKYAMMFAALPDLFIFDEPLNSLDKEAENVFISELNKANQNGQSAIMAMHPNSNIFSLIKKHHLLQLSLSA
jgi:ABC-type multidrug transport system ATPase subunit